eukprot:TRINITY_DN11826_c0_g1_i1.p1 TRINITY_DN11826_c0_g1~~TRINITY_DN11826_c0_g1_i1.p1  ORF type:complete len:835 (+),score=236.61 TRINITY_DN11826_c0_g1_i1:125-2629(+)
MGKAEPLLPDMGQSDVAAIAMSEAINDRSFSAYPKSKVAYSKYASLGRLRDWSRKAIMGLLMLTCLETPLWCRGHKWKFHKPHEVCAIEGVPESEIQLSGMIMLPIYWGLAFEYICLAVIAMRIIREAQVNRCFLQEGGGVRYVNSGEQARDRFMLFLAVGDAAFYTAYPDRTVFRLAPFVRFGLAVSIPFIEQILYIFLRVTNAIVQVGLFQLTTIVIFAWIAASLFDDMGKKEDMYGNPLNMGFESFSNSLYASFETMTTANLLDVMVPSYTTNRLFILLWLPFTFLSTCIFANVILSSVYNEYSDAYTQALEKRVKHKNAGVAACFDLAKEQHVSEAGSEDVVKMRGFEKLVGSLKALMGSNISLDQKILHILFQALDDDGNEMLTKKEFFELSDVLQYKFKVTKRDSMFRTCSRCCKGSCVDRFLRCLMDNRSDGPDLGYDDRFEGSCFDVFMNMVLVSNTVWIVVQSYYDLSNLETPPYFERVDLFFCFFYLLEVGMKLLYWSFAEYWTSTDNRFDFVTTFVLAAAASLYIFPAIHVDRETLRYLNMLRIVRILKALSNNSYFRRICYVIKLMITSCQQVLAMNFLIVYLFAALGMQMFGGRLYESNPALKGQDYFDSHLQAWNFNDMGSGICTMFYFMLCGWIGEVASVVTALEAPYTPFWVGAHTFMFSFYVVGPLLAWNVFAAFSIDVYCKLDSMMNDGDMDAKDEVSQNLKKMQAKYAEEGYALHIWKSAEVVKAKLLREMYGLDGGDDAGGDADAAKEGGDDAAAGKGSGDSDAVTALRRQLADSERARLKAEDAYAQVLKQLHSSLDWMSNTMDGLATKAPPS